MKLIKLKDKFILVSDEEPKEGDLVLAKDTGTVFQCNKHEASKPIKQFKELYTKVISKNPDFSLLSKEDCKKIGWVDELSLAEVNTEKHHYAFGQQSEFYQLGFIEGFKTAQSLNDKMFNEKVLNKAFELGKNVEREDCTEKFIAWKQSLPLQQTEWDVEVEMETINQDYRFDVGQITRPKITNNSIKILRIL